MTTPSGRGSSSIDTSIAACYRPRSEVSEGYVFTGVCHSVTSRGGGVTPNASWDRSHGQRLEGGGSAQHLPPLYNTSLPPQTRSQHLPPCPLDNTSLPPLDDTSLPPLDNTSLPSRTRSQHLPPPPGNTSLPLLDSTCPPLDNTSLPPPPWTTPPFPPPPSDQVTTPSPRDYAQAGGTHPTGMHSCIGMHCDA